MCPGEGDKTVVDTAEEIKPDAGGKYPEVVPWSKYVGIKESLGNKLTAERTKVASLEERLKTVPSTDEFTKVKADLAEAKTKLQTTTDELNTTKNKTLSEKRGTLTKGGIPEAQTKDMTDKELDAALLVLGSRKPPSPDLGGGGGQSPIPKGTSPMELARRAYTK